MRTLACALEMPMSFCVSMENLSFRFLEPSDEQIYAQIMQSGDSVSEACSQNAHFFAISNSSSSFFFIVSSAYISQIIVTYSDGDFNTRGRICIRKMQKTQSAHRA